MKKLINEVSGNYLGTEINGKWWKRFKKNKMFARGNGKFWADNENIYFHRRLTKEPFLIAFKDITDFSTGKWHSGKWLMGYSALKIIWQKNGLNLSSGFFLSKSDEDIYNLINKLKQIKNTAR